MALTIPDEWLAEAGINERDARIEIGCRLFDAGRLPLAQAIRPFYPVPFLCTG